MKKCLLTILMLCAVISCDNSKQQNLFPAYYSGTYVFSDVESMTLGVWLRADSTFLLLKKVDTDTLYRGVVGNWKQNEDVIQLVSVDAGRLLVKQSEDMLEILNNDGEQIMREPKFRLRRLSDIPSKKLSFLVHARLFTSDTLPVYIQACNSKQVWNVSNDLSNWEKEKSGLEIFSHTFDFVISIESTENDFNTVKIMDIRQPSTVVNCEN